MFVPVDSRPKLDHFSHTGHNKYFYDKIVQLSRKTFENSKTGQNARLSNYHDHLKFWPVFKWLSGLKVPLSFTVKGIQVHKHNFIYDAIVQPRGAIQNPTGSIKCVWYLKGLVF
jgi:hypothetical protein